MGRLQSVREYVYNRVQTTLGFAFLLAGFGFQLIGRFREVVPEGSGAAEPPLSMAWVGVIVASAIILLFSGWWWSVWAFRRYVREYFTDSPRDFMADPAVAREVGELFGIESGQDDTVEDYVKRLVSETGLPHIGAQRLSQSASQASGSSSVGQGGRQGSSSSLGQPSGSSLRGTLPPGAASVGGAPGVGGFAGASILPDDFE